MGSKKSTLQAKVPSLLVKKYWEIKGIKMNDSNRPRPIVNKFKDMKFVRKFTI